MCEWQGIMGYVRQEPSLMEKVPPDMVDITTGYPKTTSGFDDSGVADALKSYDEFTRHLKGD